MGEMKAELNINTDELISRITQEVVKAIKPLVNHDHKTDRLMDVKGLADYLQVKESWIYGKVHKREIPFYKAGKFPRFRKKFIDIWLKNPYSSELDNFNLNHNGKGVRKSERAI